MGELKKCSECGEELPRTEEYFRKASGNKEGFRGQCKKCIAKQKRHWNIKNKDIISRKRKVYRKEYYKNNKEAIAKYKKQYYQKNKNYVVNKVRKYYEENRNHLLEYGRKYSAKYSKEHLAARCINQQKRKSLKKQLPSTLTIKQWEIIKTQFNNQCCYCGQVELLTQEHFIPLSKGGEYTHNNIIPSCKSCNSSKNDKSFFEWYPKHEHYNKEREKFILDFLGYSNEKQQLSMII